MLQIAYLLLGIIGAAACFEIYREHERTIKRITDLERRMDELDPKRLPYPVADGLENLISNYLYTLQALEDQEIKHTVAKQRIERALAVAQELRGYGTKKGNGK